ncbi:MAG: transglycosylase domain-containing protein [Bacteroidetes bacterium]|nr:transglycosylase domain-containing protein [Bacteroidota bacterium]
MNRLVEKLFSFIQKTWLVFYPLAWKYIKLAWSVFTFINRKFFIPPKGMKWKYKILWRIGNLLILMLLFLFLVDVNFLWMFGKSPRIRYIFNPDQKLTSELYSADGVLVAKYYDENRTPLQYQDIPTSFFHALISTEDSRFYQHHGIDFKATLSVFYYMAKGEKRGGSTITQQLVKNLFKTRSNYSRGLLGYIPYSNVLIYKTKEWITALKIEWLYPKEKILTMYCNTIDFGSNSFGLKTACKTFFNKLPAELRPEETALLIGMLKAPTYYSPVLHPDNALQRRNVVLGQMLKNHSITQEAHDSLVQLPMKLDYQSESSTAEGSSYLRDAVSNYLRTWLKTNDRDLFEDGLKIYCTVDSRLQALAEEAVTTHMKRLQKRFYQQWEGQNPWSDRHGVEIPGYITNIAAGTVYYNNLKTKYKALPDSIDYYLSLPKKMKVFSWKGEMDTTLSFLDSIRYYNRFLHAGFFAMDQNTGFIKVWVGGINHKYFKFDHVKQSRRQPGSTFKAFVYAAALDQGYGPCDKFSDVPVTYTYQENGQTKSWSPRNADATFSGREVTLKYAFAKSINSIAVQLTKIMGFQKVKEYAALMGITTPIQDVPSICLGSSDVSLFELVNAYCPMVNGGYAIDPVLVTRIEDKDGRVIYENKEEKKRVLSEETAFYLQTLLQAGLTEPGGTTQALFEYDLFRFQSDFGGKTGTSSNHSDGWFIGVTPNLIGGAWVGGDNRSVHFKSSELGEGCKTALPIYGLFMEKVISDKRFKNLGGRFKKPEAKITREYTCHTLLPPSDTIPADSSLIINDSLRIE